MPKGVMLSHHNLISNIEAVAQVFWIPTDHMQACCLSSTPFGFFAHTLWFPLVAGAAAVVPPNQWMPNPSA